VILQSLSAHLPQPFKTELMIRSSHPGKPSPRFLTPLHTALCVLALVAFVIATQPGCATALVTASAIQKQTVKDSHGHTHERSNPAYFALLPLSLPIDFATLPILFLLSLGTR
jgi:hypothetical protein